MNIIFGPVNSRRFGKSLGVDLSPQSKQCNFDCLYCELAPAKVTDAQSNVIEVQTIFNEIKRALEHYSDIDVLTITANGEPTLYPYLLELIDKINSVKGSTQTLILSNASTIADKKVQKALLKFDSVKLSLDCATQKCFRKLDRPGRSIDLETIKKGMLAFKEIYRGKLLIEILFVAGLNDNLDEITALNSFLLQLQPSRIDIGTVDRPPAYKIEPISYEKLYELSLAFDAALPIAIAAKAKGSVAQFDYTKEEILNTIAKRPLTPEDIKTLFSAKSQELLNELLVDGKIEKCLLSGVIFYKVKV